MPKTVSNFSARAGEALRDTDLRAKLRKAMDGLMGKRLVQFPDPDELEAFRSLAESIKRRALVKLPDLLEQLEEKCTANGIQVHWALDPAEANKIVLDILEGHGAKSLVKGKSMVSEEMHLNAYLEKRGIEAIESDLGEYVIQLAGETPSHIIMPCIHKSKEEVAELFDEKIDGAGYTDDVEELTAIARKALRRAFAEADAGISGVNFAVAETGTLCLVENEGNGRMSTTAPPVHIAVMGIEKVVEKLEDVPPLYHVLTRSATGQHITTYFNMITSPRKEGEKDGPKEVHLILLDNRRSSVYTAPRIRRTLQCIRCGACMNHCPVYTRIGGHAYNAVYPGPIGKIITPQIEGMDKQGDLPSASSLCNACVEVCPVKIPIAEILVKLREEGVSCSSHSPVLGAGAKRGPIEPTIWKGWAKAHANPTYYGWMSSMLTTVGNLMPGSMPLLSQWTSVRSKPKFAKKTLHQLAKEKGYDHD